MARAPVESRIALRRIRHLYRPSRTLARHRTKGAFNVYGRVPETSDARCSFQAGLFQDTLLPFINRHDFSRRLVIHLDADLFSSTLYVLTTLARHFKPGDIIFFDNFICSLDEFRAFEDWVKSFRVNYEVLGEVQEYIRVCVKIV